MNTTDRYKKYCRPKLGELLDVINLNQEFIKGNGAILQTSDHKQVIDFVSGFGSALLGHNPPELVEKNIALLSKSLPVMVQSSVRGSAARLANKLSDLLSEKQSYCCNFTNSGTEAVEAAIKHCYKVHFDKMVREYERLTRALNDFYYAYEKLENQPPLPDNKDLIDFRDDLDEYNLAQLEAFQYKPTMLSLKGSFHGKTSASVKVTFNKSFREAFEGISSINSVFVDPNKPERIKEVIEEDVSVFYYPVLINNQVKLRAIRITRVMGFIFEVIMGEGGIKALPDHTLNYLADHHKSLGIPYIIDEIQTGCGRIGDIYGFKTTALANIVPEYVLLSKALGGGLTKIGATLIRADIYDDDFGILHTSTFGEDELSAEIASHYLDILQRNNGEVLTQCKNKGALLLNKLSILAKKYPAVIKEARGKGLMIALEFTTLASSSPFFRSAGKQGILSLLVASFLMHHHGIRVLAPISTILKGNPGKTRQSMIRIQPPVCIENSHIDLLINALDQVCKIISHNNEFLLIAHLIGYAATKNELAEPTPFDAKWPLDEQKLPIDARIGFIVHPTSLSTLIDYYFPSFSYYSVEENKFNTWWNSISRFLEPIHVKNEYVNSNDFCIQTALVTIPYLPEYMTEKHNKTITKEIQDKVQDAVTVARELGDDNIPVSIVGLGAFTSIVSGNGETINHYEVPVTTGNAYTIALSIQGCYTAAEKQGLNIAEANIAIIGATGNIGSVIAELLAPRVGGLSLIGSNKFDSLKRLQLVEKRCIKTINEAMTVEGIDDTELGVLALNILAATDVNLSEKLGIEVGNDIALVKDADIIIVATNNSKSLLTSDDVKEKAIVCCTSVPSNLSDSFKDHPTIIAFDGGLAQLPGSSQVNFAGMPKNGLAFGCLAETMILGFDGQNHSFSKGAITASQVHEIVEKAQLHDFYLGELKLSSSTSTI